MKIPAERHCMDMRFRDIGTSQVSSIPHPKETTTGTQSTAFFQDLLNYRSTTGFSGPH